MLTKVLGEKHGKKYPGSAGIGTVMEQTCVNGGAVWDGPELIWTEDFQNLSDSRTSVTVTWMAIPAATGDCFLTSRVSGLICGVRLSRERCIFPPVRKLLPRRRPC